MAGVLYWPLVWRRMSSSAAPDRRPPAPATRVRGADVIATLRRFVDTDGTSVVCVAHERPVIDVADRVRGWRTAAYTDAAEPLMVVTNHGVS